MIRKILNKIFIISFKNRINIFKTLLINFMLFPLNKAIYLPIYIYGKCEFQILNGSVDLTAPIKKGMLKIGISDPSRSAFSKSYLSLSGKMTIGNNVVLRRGIHLNVEKSGFVILRDDVYVGDNCSITSKYKIEIQEKTRIGNNTTFLDTDFHYMIDKATNEIKNNVGSIEIGAGNWIGSHCVIKKNTITPNYTIVAGPFSMLSKNYTKTIPEYSCIGGSPAKLIYEGLRRINNEESEQILYKHFLTTDKAFIFNDSNNFESFCSPNH
jgi:carbonic anhydrase/acetyltransferase-like protein (isoleucine patch superfamily)